jgi:hypothetical protein
MTFRPRIATYIAGRYGVRVAADRAKVDLTKNGARVGYLRVVFQCTSDTAHDYFAVQSNPGPAHGRIPQHPARRPAADVRIGGRHSP